MIGLSVLKNTRYFVWLGVAVVAFIATILSHLVSQSNEIEGEYATKIQYKIQQELATSEVLLQRWIEKIRTLPNPPSLGDLYEPTPHLTLVYREQQLTAWTDHRTIPEWASLSGIDRVGLLSTVQGSFLVVHQQQTIRGSVYDVYVLIELYHRFKYENNYLQSGYNRAVFAQDPLALHASPQEGAIEVRSATGDVLFAVTPPAEQAYTRPSISNYTLLWGLLTAIAFGIFLVTIITRLTTRHRYGWGFVLLSSYLILLRLGMLYFSVPNFSQHPELPQTNAALRLFAPTLGDLFLNHAALLLIVAYMVMVYFRTVLFRRLYLAASWVHLLLMPPLILLSYLLFYAYKESLNTIFLFTNSSLDITLSLLFDYNKLFAFGVFIIASSSYFLLQHIIINILISWGKQRLGIGPVLAVPVVGLLGLWVMGHYHWLFGLHTAYLWILYFTQVPRRFFCFHSPSTLYYFLGAILTATLMTFVVYSQESRRDLLNKRDFAQFMLAANDPLAEFYLKRSIEAIRQDTVIQTALVDGRIFASEIIQQRVKEIYFDGYLDKYLTTVISFDKDGKSLFTENGDQRLDYWVENYKPLSSGRRGDNSLFFESDPAKHYVILIPIMGSDQTLVGHIILDLKDSSDYQQITYPELFLDKQFVQAPETRAYSYGIFLDQSLVLTRGDYNYGRRFPAALLTDSSLYDQGRSYGGYWHVGRQDGQHRRVVVSSKEWQWRGIFANFSFLFLLLVACIALTLLVYVVRYAFVGQKLSYSAKIQILLNIAFMFPLLIVMGSILTIIRSNYTNNQEAMYLSNSRNISANIQGYLEDWQQGRMSKAYLEQEIRSLARESENDITIYDEHGCLFVASKPLLYKNKALSSYLNPIAYRQILEEKERQLLLDETLGSKTYRAAYASLQTRSSQWNGVMRMAFYDSNEELNRQIIDIISSVLIVFTLMILVFLIMSYFASDSLITPLRLLTYKIRKTNLDKLNEPVEWPAKDEFGMMIGEYNKMLVKLEESKQALSTTEKQSAWREMAKQVAHEIKNPLTPMKLTLQQLQRTIRRDDPSSIERVSKAMDSVIEQIDNIGYIAQSFSEIAKIPPPKRELFDITEVVSKSVELYVSDSSISMMREIERGPIHVEGDRQQFGNSINNLLINAIQSVPTGRRPTIQVRLYTHDDDVLLEIQDNGSGIPKSIQNRVFLPNFTTREGGSGFGLAMAKRIVEHAGGIIWFDTEENVGTTFHISIPFSTKH